MSLILATGSNLGDRLHNLNCVKNKLSEVYSLIFASSVYESQAVDYIDQPAFLNQVLEFRLPDESPVKTLHTILNLETILGRKRRIEKGPRVIDIDLLYFGTQSIRTNELILPHPRILERSFVVKPLREVPYFKELEKYYQYPSEFSVEAVVRY